jgi:hypothetical protein
MRNKKNNNMSSPAVCTNPLLSLNSEMIIPVTEKDLTDGSQMSVPATENGSVIKIHDNPVDRRHSFFKNSNSDNLPIFSIKPNERDFNTLGLRHDWEPANNRARDFSTVGLQHHSDRYPSSFPCLELANNTTRDTDYFGLHQAFLPEGYYSASLDMEVRLVPKPQIKDVAHKESLLTAPKLSHVQFVPAGSPRKDSVSVLGMDTGEESPPSNRSPPSSISGNEFGGLCFIFDAETWGIAHRIENDGTIYIEERGPDLTHLPQPRQDFEQVCNI